MLYLLSECFLVALCTLSPLLGLVCSKLSDTQGRRSVLISCSRSRQMEWERWGDMGTGGTDRHAVRALFWKRKKHTNVKAITLCKLIFRVKNRSCTFWNCFNLCTLNLSSEQINFYCKIWWWWDGHWLSAATWSDRRWSLMGTVEIPRLLHPFRQTI